MAKTYNLNLYDLPCADTEHHASHLQTHLLQQHGKVGNEPQDPAVPYGHSEIGVTINTYTHLGLHDATDEFKRVQEAEDARKEQEKLEGKKPVSQKMFRAI